MAYLGIDIGTSGVKVVVCNEAGSVEYSESASLTVSNPHPLWSEQSPEDWWQAIETCMSKLQQSNALAQVKAIGLAGQMHGAVMLDKDNSVLRPAILWNDGRCVEECNELTAAVPEVKAITGNLVMPGFTAPKLLWVKKHEPEVFSQIAKVLLPKDYVRFKLTGTYVSDMSDSAGTAWLDVAKRDWCDELLTACDLTREQMPTLCEGTENTGLLLDELATRWGMQAVPVAGGGGDNAAGAIGSGVIESGQTMLSLGTSGVMFSVSDRFLSNPERTLHSFCHALPDKWHVMSVHLSAACCLQWFADIAANGNVVELLEEMESADINPAQNCLFLPFLSGERTPFNNPSITGEFVGLTAATNRANMTYAILEGVAFSFKTGLEVMQEADVKPSEVTIIGGGAKSAYWRQLMADVLGITMVYRESGEVGPALGAARLAQVLANPETPVETICPVSKAVCEHQPDADKSAVYNRRFELYKTLSAQADEQSLMEQLS